MITQLPPLPVAKALNLVSVAVWIAAFAIPVVRAGRLDRRIVWGLCAVGASVAISFVVAGSYFPVVVYDLFGDMPLLQWMAFPVVFGLACLFDGSAEALKRALSAVVGAGVVIVAVMAFQQQTTSENWVFGTTAYSITALAPLIPIAAGLAIVTSGTRRVVWFAAAAFVAGVLAFSSESQMGTVATLFTVLGSAGGLLLVDAGGGRARRWAGGALALGAALLVVGMLAIQFTAVNEAVVSRAGSLRANESVMSRVYLWRGAQDMVVARPIAGWGPSGYRVFAANYLRAEALQFGPDVEGNADPTVYSPQSPHSVLWETLSRLGLLGLAALLFLGVQWGRVLVSRVRQEPDSAVVRVSVAIGFASAVFCVLANPVLFPIGLFVAVMPGLAVAPVSSGADKVGPVGNGRRLAMLAAAAVLAVAAVWLGVGEWNARAIDASDPFTAAIEYDRVLAGMPGHPMTLRRSLETRLLIAGDEAQSSQARAAVDESPEYMRDFAPNLVNFVAFSLAQADRTGRTDVRWEQEQLARADAALPPIPSLVAEQLHVALTAGDVVATRSALGPARRWGGPYPYTEAYIARAEELLK